MNWPMMKENIATPKSRMKAAIALSRGLTGEKSPKPIVDRVVSEKYMILTSYLTGVISSASIVFKVPSFSVSKVGISGSSFSSYVVF